MGGGAVANRRADHSGKLASQIAMRWKIRWLGLPVRIRARVQLQPTVLTRVYRSGTAIDEDIDTDDQPYRRRQYLYPSSSSRIRAVGDRLERSLFRG